MKKLKALILFSVIYYATLAAQVTTPKYETRAVWLTTLGGLDWPGTYATSASSAEIQRKELMSILDKLQDAGINTILFQVRTRSALTYPSEIEPWAQCLTGRLDRNPGYDPLEFAVRECHKRGMELHAWVTTIPAGRWNSRECRLLRDRMKGAVKRVKDQGYLNPADRRTGDYLSRICCEIARKYDVDGIHLDYIRYPENLHINISPDRARNNITAIVRKIYNDVKSLKPWIKVSCSPIGKYSDLSRYSSRGWNARDKVFQDAQQWMREGIMDIIFPMMYFKGDNYYPFLINWMENKHGREMVSGLGIYMLSPREMNWNISEIKRQMHVSRQYGAGYAFFRSKFFTDNTKGLYTFTKDVFNRHPALTPPMEHNACAKPEAPEKIEVKYSGDYYIVSWNKGCSFDNSPYCTYNLYASHSYPVDVSKAENLIRWRKRDNSAVIKMNSRPLYFAVAAYDRYGQESDARQQEDVLAPGGISSITECDGGELIIDAGSADAEYVVIESLDGCIVALLRCNHGKISAHSLPKGMFILRTLNRRGISHRIGFINNK